MAPPLPTMRGRVDPDLDDQGRLDADVERGLLAAERATDPRRRQLDRPGMVVPCRGEQSDEAAGGRRGEGGGAGDDVELVVARGVAAEDQVAGPVEGAGDSTPGEAPASRGTGAGASVGEPTSLPRF